MLNCNRPGWLDHDGTEYVELSDVFDPEPALLRNGKAVILDSGRAIGPVLDSLRDAWLMLEWLRRNNRTRELCDASGTSDLMTDFRKRNQCYDPIDL